MVLPVLVLATGISSAADAVCNVSAGVAFPSSYAGPGTVRLHFSGDATACCALCTSRRDCAAFTWRRSQSGTDCLIHPAGSSLGPPDHKDPKSFASGVVRPQLVPVPIPPAPPLRLLPPWTPTYNMARSTIIEPCSSTKKPFNASLCASFGICDIDWSNQKPLWSHAKPMNCSEVLVDQARLVKAVNNDTRVFVYRNLVKALPWQIEVREKLEDPQWWGFFLHKKNTTGTDATGVLYHDFGATPKGDCGLGVQCGEYLWDHRNGTMLQDFLINTYVGGKLGMGSPFVDGIFIDDHWSANGPSEEDRGAVAACGLSVAEVSNMTYRWRENMDAAQRAIVAAGGFNEQLMMGEYHVHQAATVPPCAEFLREACKPNSTIASSALMYGFTQVSESPHRPFLPNGSLPAFEQDLATFLLVRGQYAWLGYGWLGCGDDSGSCQYGQYVRPPALDIDYGEPLGHCTEQGTSGSGVFARNWTRAFVKMDCNVGKYGQATITMKAE